MNIVRILYEICLFSILERPIPILKLAQSERILESSDSRTLSVTGAETHLPIFICRAQSLTNLTKTHRIESIWGKRLSFIFPHKVALLLYIVILLLLLRYLPLDVNDIA